MEQRIVSVVPGSIAEELEIEAGDVLVSVNGQMPEDVFDYRYLINEEQLLVLIRKVADLPFRCPERCSDYQPLRTELQS